MFQQMSLSLIFYTKVIFTWVKIKFSFVSYTKFVNNLMFGLY